MSGQEQNQQPIAIMKVPEMVIETDKGQLVEPLPMCGGFGEKELANEDTQKICDAVKQEAETCVKKTFNVFKAVAFKKQTVAGYNHHIKVHVGGDEYVDLLVFESLEGELGLRTVQHSKSLDL